MGGAQRLISKDRSYRKIIPCDCEADFILRLWLKYLIKAACYVIF